jgi:lipopolysaccharide/colanic/teichoic acid biosynthesis glycosyltransferase
MRIRSPSSRGNFLGRICVWDACLAAASPILALCLRNALILTSDDRFLIVGYWLISFISSLTAFGALGIDDGIPRYLSVRDLMILAKAVLASELMATGMWFVLTRLQGVPRSVPVIHGLILGAGLISVRVLAHVGDAHRQLATRRGHVPGRHSILIGLNEWSVLYLKFLDTCGARQEVIGVLDNEPRWTGRTVEGVRVFGPPSELESLIDEFHVHGVRTDRVIAVAKVNAPADAALSKVQSVCARRNIEFVLIPHLFDPEPAIANPFRSSTILNPVAVDFALPRYFAFKRAIDLSVAALLLVLLSPLLIIVVIIAFFDVGLPVFFWQQRTGLHGRDFLVHKIRTLRMLSDLQGLPLPEEERSSWIGQLLRKTRLDELPQLLNVLVGDMSLVGPRPLLLEDQPPAPTIRLKVRPGITGWAQVNGGTLLSSLEKGQLDEWYIRKASLWFDLRIAWLTVLSVIRGNRRSEQALLQARAANSTDRGANIVRLHGDATAGVAATVELATDEKHERSVAAPA